MTSELGTLVPCGGGDPIPLIKNKLLIGRRSQCDIALRFPNVSSHHCEIELIDGYWFVRDLNSRNGTFVNGRRVTGEVQLRHGSCLRFHEFEFEFCDALLEQSSETEFEPRPVRV